MGVEEKSKTYCDLNEISQHDTLPQLYFLDVRIAMFSTESIVKEFGNYVILPLGI